MAVLLVYGYIDKVFFALICRCDDAAKCSFQPYIITYRMNLRIVYDTMLYFVQPVFSMHKALGKK